MLDVGALEQKGLGDVRLILFAGEVFPVAQLARLRAALPSVRLINLFGPTETNVCTYYEVPRGRDLATTRPIPIGQGCENLSTFVLDAEEQEVSAGEPGILWVSGDNFRFFTVQNHANPYFTGHLFTNIVAIALFTPVGVIIGGHAGEGVLYVVFVPIGWKLGFTWFSSAV